MHMQEDAGTIKQKYRLMRYFALLLAVAVLLTGVTFARYVHGKEQDVSQGIAAFDAGYSIQSVNSVTFGNVNYWQYYSGAWLEQGTARTVRILMTNRSDVALRPVLHLEGPAEFWENVALQLTLADGTAAGAPVTMQIVLADLLRRRQDGQTESGQTHTFSYGDYWDWNAATGEARTWNTAQSDNFGERAGVGDATLAMSGGIKKEEGSFTGAVSAAWGTGENAWSMTIAAQRKQVSYSIGFARKQANGNHSLPAMYVDCSGETDYYAIDITLPQSLCLPAADQGEEVQSTLIAFMTWTNSMVPGELKAQDHSQYQNFFEELQRGSATQTPGGIQVTGYRFNYNGVAATQNGENILTTVCMVRRFGESGLSWQHVASMQSGDGLFAHDMTLQGDNYVCKGLTPVTIASSTLAALNNGAPQEYDPATLVTVSSEHDGETTTYIQASEKSYALTFRVQFVQASETPSR